MISHVEVLKVRSQSATRVLVCAISLGFAAVAGLVQAQSPNASPVSAGIMVYPAKGQSARQQDQDKYECYNWARGETGFDPTQAPQSAPAGQSNQARGSSGGLMRAAVGGAAVGELAHGDAGRGAAVGIVGGALRERAREQQAAQARQQQAAQQQAIRGQQRAIYDRAFGACMEGRGYSVK